MVCVVWQVYKVAEAMQELHASASAEFVVGLGDSFYWCGLPTAPAERARLVESWAACNECQCAWPRAVICARAAAAHCSLGPRGYHVLDM